MTDHYSNYDKVLDIIEHPERYSDQQLSQIFSDPEVREVYELLCMTDSAIESNDLRMDVDAEWMAFACNHPARRHAIFPWLGNRAASIVVIAGASIVAVAAGIAVTVAVSDHKYRSHSVREAMVPDVATEAANHEMAMVNDSIAVAPSPIMFEDQSLESIMKTIEAIYGVEIRFNNKETAALHLYYRLNPSLAIEDVVAQLNTFEQLNIHLTGNILTID